MNIREAVETDIVAITAIYGDAVLNETGTFEMTPPDEPEMARRMRLVQDGGFPWLVAESDGVVEGYAYANLFKPRAAYSGTVENSVYIAQDARGKGLGKALVNQLIERCTEMGKSEMIAIIGGSDSVGSIGLHTACGFREVGKLENVGVKFGRTLDTVYMQRSLGD